MLIVPETRVGKIDFYEAHLEAWALHAAAIGLSKAEVSDLADRLKAARDDYRAHKAAQDAAKAAAQRFRDSVAALHAGPGGGSGLIAKIKAKAARDDDPGVYVLAQIPAPAPRRRPGHGPAPGAAEGVAAGLRPTGDITLAWKRAGGGRAGGTVYEVRRRVERFADELAPASGTAAGEPGIAKWRAGFAESAAKLSASGVQMAASRGGLNHSNGGLAQTSHGVCVSQNGISGPPSGVPSSRSGIPDINPSAAAGASRPFEYLGLTGRKRFIDETLPPGAVIVTYEITAIRSARRGAPVRFTMQIGSTRSTPQNRPRRRAG